jgi:hypothetical protein
MSEQDNEKSEMSESEGMSLASLFPKFVIGSIQVVEVLPPDKNGFCDEYCGLLVHGDGGNYCKGRYEKDGPVYFPDGKKSNWYCEPDLSKCPGAGEYVYKEQLWGKDKGETRGDE